MYEPSHIHIPWYYVYSILFLTGLSFSLELLNTTPDGHRSEIIKCITNISENLLGYLIFPIIGIYKCIKHIPRFIEWSLRLLPRFLGWIEKKLFDMLLRILHNLLLLATTLIQGIVDLIEYIYDLSMPVLRVLHRIIRRFVEEIVYVINYFLRSLTNIITSVWRYANIVWNRFYRIVYRIYIIVWNNIILAIWDRIVYIYNGIIDTMANVYNNIHQVYINIWNNFENIFGLN